jgi:hypothetical protein
MTEIGFWRPLRQDTAEPVQPSTVVVERDDGLFQIGLEDHAAGLFPSRTFAAIAAHTRGGGKRPCRRHNGPLAGDRSGKRPRQHQHTVPTHRRAPRAQ